MASKKSLKAKTPTKKKPVTKKGKTKPPSKPSTSKKNTKASSVKKVSGVAKKPKKIAKSKAKKKVLAQAAVGKKKTLTQKTVSKKMKATPKKKAVKSVSKAKVKKSVQKKPLVYQKNVSVAKRKVTSSQATKLTQKGATSSTPAAQRVAKSKEPLLSANERYNIGGLFACAIERRHDPDCSRLRAVLRFLDLASQEKDNLIRLSEGFMIPKLFAENLAEPKVNQLLADLVKFARRQENYERYWREEIQQIGFWLGVFPAHFQAIEHQVQR